MSIRTSPAVGSNTPLSKDSLNKCTERHVSSGADLEFVFQKAYEEPLMSFIEGKVNYTAQVARELKKDLDAHLDVAIAAKRAYYKTFAGRVNKAFTSDATVKVEEFRKLLTAKFDDALNRKAAIEKQEAAAAAALEAQRQRRALQRQTASPSEQRELELILNPRKRRVNRCALFTTALLGVFAIGAAIIRARFGATAS